MDEIIELLEGMDRNDLYDIVFRFYTQKQRLRKNMRKLAVMHSENAELNRRINDLLLEREQLKERIRQGNFLY